MDRLFFVDENDTSTPQLRVPSPTIWLNGTQTRQFLTATSTPQYQILDVFHSSSTRLQFNSFQLHNTGYKFEYQVQYRITNSPLQHSNTQTQQLDIGYFLAPLDKRFLIIISVAPGKKP
ncbi:hypothetical protein PoB_006190000 [Plakobranchus ocellatus]|uniref:Uncharacterized protein n=1 Tax=Plakobranchus ocellatus TaxID=259542 RepID=A0AAV4CU68_9GAST|nr:hypothetical protein PoB_006190000 [Plakobranchus ocellatus]